MKKRILTAAVSAASALALAVSANAATLTPTSAPKAIDFSQEEISNGEVWLHAINIWNENAMYLITDIDADAKDIIISFDVSGCDGTYNMLVGFQINDGATYAWSADAYVETVGAAPEYVIDHDGSYEIIVPTYLFMQAQPSTDPDTGEDIYQESIQSIECVEPWVFGLGETSGMTVTITDIKLSNTVHTLEECASPTAGSSEKPSGNSEEASGNNATGSTDVSAAADKGNVNTGVEGVALVGGAALLAAVVTVLTGKGIKRR